MILSFLSREGSPSNWRDWRYFSRSTQGIITGLYGEHISRNELFSEKVAREIKYGIKEMIGYHGPSIGLLESLAQSIILEKIVEAGRKSFTPSDATFLYDHAGYDCLDLCGDFQREIESLSQHCPKNTERVNFTFSSNDYDGSSQNMVYINYGLRNHYLVDIAAYLFHPNNLVRVFHGTDKNAVVKQGVNWMDGVYPGWRA